MFAARIWTGCEYICSAYDHGQDTAFYMCPDKITSLAAASLSGTNSVDAVLGCQVHAGNIHSDERHTFFGLLLREVFRSFISAEYYLQIRMS